MLTVQELEEVKTYVLRELPRVLAQDPQFVTAVENIVNEKFPRRDEFARLLDELQATRWENRNNFANLNEWRAKIDEQFGKDDWWRAQTDVRLDKIDERLQEDAQWRDKADERFDKIDERLQEDAQWRDKADERFDKIDERLQEDAQWRDKADERFDKIDEWQAKSDRDWLHQRRENVFVRAQLDRMNRRMDAQDAWMQLYSGRLGSDKGQRLEDTFALALRYGLRNPGLAPDDIHLRVKLIDREGLVYPPGVQTEVDIVIQGQRWTVFEIKAAAEEDDVDKFAFKLKLLRLQQTEKEIRGVFFSCIEDEWLQQRCRLYQIELIEPFATLPKGPPTEEDLDAAAALDLAAIIPDEQLE